MKTKSITKQYEQGFLAWYKQVFIALGRWLIELEILRLLGEIIHALFIFAMVILMIVLFPIGGFALAWFVRRNFKKQHEKFYNETSTNNERKIK